MKELKFSVPDMSCNHCVQSIESHLKAIEGIQAVTADLPTKSVTVVFDESLTADFIKESLDDVGFEATEQ